MAPRDEHEMARMIEFAVNNVSGPVAIRYPRGSGSGKRHYNRLTPLKSVKGELLATGREPVMIVSVGIMERTASEAVLKLEKKGHEVFHYDLRFVKPLPEELFEIIKKNNISKLVTIEDGIMAGGAGSAILEALSNRNLDVKCRIIGINDTFSTHGTQNELKKLEGLTVENIVKAVLDK